MPESVETPGAPPPVGPPSSVPPPPDAPVGYSGSPEDLAAFIGGYRSAFQIPELTDQQIADAGARLCSYLQGQAGPDGVVDAARALADAEMHEPGYPREAWVAAFQVASETYCPAFSFDVEGEG